MSVAIWIVTNGRLCEEFKSTVEHILGEKTSIRTFPFCKEDNPSEFEKILEEAFSDVPSETGILAFVDVFGSTPSNVLSRVRKGSERMEIVSGVNLAAILKAWKISQTVDSPKIAAEQVIVYAREKIFACRRRTPR